MVLQLLLVVLDSTFFFKLLDLNPRREKKKTNKSPKGHKDILKDQFKKVGVGTSSSGDKCLTSSRQNILQTEHKHKNEMFGSKDY